MGGGGANKETVISQTRRRVAPGRTTGRVVRDVAFTDPGSTKASRLREARSAQLRQHHETHEQEVRE
jgi:hypothetical protein